MKKNLIAAAAATLVGAAFRPTPVIDEKRRVKDLGKFATADESAAAPRFADGTEGAALSPKYGGPCVSTAAPGEDQAVPLGETIVHDLAQATGRDIMAPKSDAELEQAIEAAKPTAPRITKEHIQSLIVDETYTNLEGTRTTVCRLQLANGFCVVGVNNGPVSAANFSQEIGCEYAYKAAVDQIWPLEGYLLAERLFAGDVYLEKVGKLRDLVAIQTDPGNAGAGEYMRGMANGLLVALSVFTGQEPPLVPEPSVSHQERVVREKTELDAKAERLGAFINGEIYATLDPAERLRLLDQHAAMTEYSNVLGARIAAF